MTARVLVVDDSALMRQMLTSILAEDPDITVVGTATDAEDARGKIRSLNPDVITLDITMPGMDGLAFLERIMKLRPMPVVMVSSRTQAGAADTVLALEMGAVDFVAKPDGDSGGILALSDEICRKVMAASNARVRAAPLTSQSARPAPALSGTAATGQVIAIGASTGGVEAIRTVLCGLPSDCPPVIITQHMPAGFTTRFADRLNEVTPLTVSEAEDGDILKPGHAFVAPGERHLTVIGDGTGRRVRLDDSGKVSGHKPSVDVMFDSLCGSLAAKTVAVILTGMGQDGAKSMLKLREAGAVTIGQDEASSVIFGMPGVAKSIGAVMHQRPVTQIAQTIVENVKT